MVYSISLTKNLHENHTYSHNKSVACFFKYWAINRWIFSLIVHNNIRFRRTAETTKNHTNSEWQNGGITKIVTQWHLSYCSEFIIALSFWLTATIARCTATIYQLHRVHFTFTTSSKRSFLLMFIFKWQQFSLFTPRLLSDEA